ncbi:holin [Salipaludibacillus agaradhaerens]|jgi:hypothetical protein|uniref:holin n=1 Tax=Salipaludibacillus agaradhaerens TaxID=76935 RepID=UPI00099838C5|nr:holin [Salipaludibacillus agaradhaerens]
METVLVLASLISPLVVAIIELVKKTTSFPKQFFPILSVIIGLLIGGVTYPLSELDLALRLWAGGIAGLAATGLFELGHCQVKLIKKQQSPQRSPE